MDFYEIEGGTPLVGEVSINGAKNAALPLMAASLLSSEPSVLHRVPDIEDVHTMADLLRSLGARVEWQGKGSLMIQAGPGLSPRLPDELTRKMRASVLLMGPLLARLGEVELSHPGGCAIGPRPINLHLDGLRYLGAQVTAEAGALRATTTGLQGTLIVLDFPSVGATENLMLAATAAKGVTIVRNAAREPEIVELQDFLNKMGARIRGAGTDTIRVRGVRELHGAEHRVIPDRIEAATFLVAGAVTRGRVTVADVIPEHLEAVLAKLEAAGCTVEEGNDLVEVSLQGRPAPIAFRALPYPGFPTDAQPQMCVLCALADGVSLVHENVFAQRFHHLEELMRMGANVFHEGGYAVITGVSKLTGATVEAADLRGGAALVLAGLAAEGITRVERAYHMDRGYESFAEKMQSLGAQLKRLAN